jgi:hypothetical protein
LAKSNTFLASAETAYRIKSATLDIKDWAEPTDHHGILITVARLRTECQQRGMKTHGGVIPISKKGLQVSEV